MPVIETTGQCGERKAPPDEVSVRASTAPVLAVGQPIQVLTKGKRKVSGAIRAVEALPSLDRLRITLTL